MSIHVGKFEEIDPVKNRFLGYRFARNGKVCGDKKCDYCGRWFSWDISNVEKYILERRWNDVKGEPVHCNNSLCQDYQNRWIKHNQRLATNAEYRASNWVEREKRRGKEEKDAVKLFMSLKEKGVVA